MSNEENTVLVTGAGGFIALHCIVQLLEAGYYVRGTVRSLERTKKIQKIIGKYGDVSEGRLSLVVADLDNDEGRDQVYFKENTYPGTL